MERSFSSLYLKEDMIETSNVLPKVMHVMYHTHILIHFYKLRRGSNFIDVIFCGQCGYVSRLPNHLSTTYLHLMDGLKHPLKWYVILSQKGLKFQLL